MHGGKGENFWVDFMMGPCGKGVGEHVFIQPAPRGPLGLRKCARTHRFRDIRDFRFFTLVYMEIW